MRPRVFPAEDARCAGVNGSEDGTSFNEAAGIPRGRPWPIGSDSRSRRRFNEAAGIPRGRRRCLADCQLRKDGFNEAAGIPRGRHSRPADRRHPPRCFNEAAGIPRGRRSRSSGTVPLTAMLQWVRLFFVDDCKSLCERHDKTYLTRRRRGGDGGSDGSVTGGGVRSA